MIRRQLQYLFGLLLFQGAWAHAPQNPDSDQPLIATQLTPHVYVAHGPQAFPSAKTGGFMNNPGFVVTRDGVVVVDPGSSVQIGRKLLHAIGKVSGKPVIAVFNTHVHGDHWLGNQAIREAYPQADIYAHERMLDHVRDGAGEEWIALFSRLTGGATDGTQVIAPDIGLRGGEVLRIGQLDFHIHHPGHAHSDNDIMVELPIDSALFTGDIVTNQRIQSARPEDSDIFGQIRAIESVLANGSKWIIPGHGNSGGPEIADQQLQFLRQLLSSVQRHYEQGMADYEMVNQVKQDLHAYRDWYNFSELGRVINPLYRQIEERDFD